MQRNKEESIERLLFKPTNTQQKRKISKCAPNLDTFQNMQCIVTLWIFQSERIYNIKKVLVSVKDNWFL